MDDYIYIYIRCTGSILVTVTRNGESKSIANPGRGRLHFTKALLYEKAWINLRVNIKASWGFELWYLNRSLRRETLKWNILNPDHEQMICLYFKITDNFMHLILQERCWVAHIPFCRMFKFHYFAQFQVDHHPHSVVSSFVLFLRYFVVLLCQVFTPGLNDDPNKSSLVSTILLCWWTRFVLGFLILQIPM